MQRVASLIHLPAARSLNLTGKGIGIAVFDTGIGRHPDLTLQDSRLKAFVDTVNHRPDFYDDNGHGTHITGIIAGNGNASRKRYEGIAPDSHFVMIKILNQKGEGNIEDVLSGIRWLLAHYRQYNIRIVNISVGSSRGRHFDENSPLVRGVEALWEEGLVVLTAAGNHGPSPHSIGAPGNSRKIITVGASDVMQTGNGRDYSGAVRPKAVSKSRISLHPVLTLSAASQCIPTLPASTAVPMTACPQAGSIRAAAVPPCQRRLSADALLFFCSNVHIFPTVRSNSSSKKQQSISVMIIPARAGD